jgi:hypothetical protein
MSISRRFYLDRAKANIVARNLSISTSINSTLNTITFNLSSNLNANTTLKFSLPNTSNSDFAEGNVGSVNLNAFGNATITRTLNKYANYSNSNITTKLEVSSLANTILANSSNFVIAPFTPIGISGGTTTLVGANTVHTFTANSNFTVTSAGDISSHPVRVVAVGGGGAGGPGGFAKDFLTYFYYFSGAGGGAGGIIDSTLLTNNFALTNYNVNVGLGGNANTYTTTVFFGEVYITILNDSVGKGSNTSISFAGNSVTFASINAVGGGVGGANINMSPNTSRNGGSGGGAGMSTEHSAVSQPGEPVTGQGSYGGGAGIITSLPNLLIPSIYGHAGGGGGGFSANGNIGIATTTTPKAPVTAWYRGGNGGTGYNASNVTGTANLFYAGGGGGGLSARSNTGGYSAGTGGSGSGGNGSYNAIGNNAITYGGGGGGAGYVWTTGGDGGSGITGVNRGGNGKEGVLHISYESRFRVLKLA